jgi:hypothetical protein
MYDKETRARTKSQRQVILNLLRQRGNRGAINSELSNIALCYGKRLSELRERGYKIATENLGNGVVKYVLVSEPEREITDRPKAFDLLLEKINELGSVTAKELETLIDKLDLQIRYKAGTFNKGV